MRCCAIRPGRHRSSFSGVFMHRSSVLAPAAMPLAGFARARRLPALLLASSALAGIVGLPARADVNITGGATEEVNGAGGGTQPSPWNVGDNLRVGAISSAGTLNILNGGEVNSLNGTVGSSGGSNGTVTVTGAGSAWTNTGILDVGNGGIGTLDIEDGGAVSNSTGRIGTEAGSTGNVTVTGTGTTWTNTGNLTVGRYGTGMLMIEAGASASNVDATIGDLVGSNGAATVTGTGSNWTSTGSEFVVGNYGHGALNIEAGGEVSNDQGFIAYQAGSTGEATITGAGSTWTNTSDLYVGWLGDATLMIEDGGAVSNRHGFIGDRANSTGEATVTGTAATWTNTGNLTVGGYGAGALTVSDGGAVSADTVTLGRRADSSGALTIEAGGALSNGEGVIGDEAGSVAAATVTGAASTWANTSNLSVGYDGAGTLSIEAGGTVSDASGVIGTNAGSTGEAMVTGAGSSWTNAGDFFVGALGTGALTIEAGGAVSNANGIMGFIAGSDGAATVTGAGSSWTNMGNLAVGLAGDGTLTIVDGGAVNSDEGIIGYDAGATGAATVTGAGSSWTNSGTLTIGFDGDGALNIGDGGMVSYGTSGAIGDQPDSTGTVTVTGAGASFTGADDLAVGYLGTGTLTLSDGGTTSANFVTLGDRTGSAGTLNIGAAAGDAAAGAGALDAPALAFGDGTGTLVFNHTDAAYEFGADISGNGAILHQAGTTFFSGDSSGFTGVFDLEGGVIGGNGALGGTVNVNSGAMIAPGNSIGTLNVADITLNAGSVYEVELNDGGFVAGTNNDLLNASGTVTIDGGTVRVTPENGADDGSAYSAPGTYTIITAGSVTGTFDSPTPTDDYVFLDFALDYDASNVYLSSERVIFFSDIAETPNQLAVAGPLEALGSGHIVHDALVGLVGNEDDARAAFDTLTGEIHASLNTALLEDSRFAREATLGRLSGANTDVDAGKFSGWMRGFGSWGDWDSDGNAAELDRSIGGVLLGGDADVGNNIRVGAFAGYADSNVDADDRASSASVETWQMGAYGGGEWNGFGLHAGGAYAWHDIGVSRIAAFTGYSNNLSADYDAGTAQIFGEAAYRLDYRAANIEPFANLAYVHLETDAYAEAGGAAALTGASQTTDATFTTLGMRGERQITAGQTAVRLSGSGGWRHSFGEDIRTTHALLSGGGAFTVAGVPIAQDAFALDLGAGVNVAENTTLGLSYSGQFGDGLIDQGFVANIAIRF